MTGRVCTLGAILSKYLGQKKITSLLQNSSTNIKYESLLENPNNERERSEQDLDKNRKGGDESYDNGGSVIGNIDLR